eukprot:767761-Hanusia_phi.AAC.2
MARLTDVSDRRELLCMVLMPSLLRRRRGSDHDDKDGDGNSDGDDDGDKYDDDGDDENRDGGDVL